MDKSIFSPVEECVSQCSWLFGDSPMQWIYLGVCGVILIGSTVSISNSMTRGGRQYGVAFMNLLVVIAVLAVLFVNPGLVWLSVTVSGKDQYKCRTQCERQYQSKETR